MDPAIIILLLFLECQLSRGQYRTDTTEIVDLQFRFDPSYNYYEKRCCKVYLMACVPFVTNSGYVDEFYKGRITLYQNSGLMVVRIWNLQKSDSGVYRCTVLNTRYSIYQDFTLEISDSANRQGPPLKPTTSRTTVTTVTTPSTPAESLNDFQSNGNLRFKSDLWIPLAAVLSSLTVFLVISVTVVVVYRRKKDKKKSGTAACDRPASVLTGSTTQDGSTIVYTTVDFKTSEQPAELYANVKAQKSPTAEGLQPYCRQDSTDTVEYSTLAIRR